jgi:hypothetical protein
MHLSTTGLPGWKQDCVAKPLEHSNDGHPDLGKQGVVVARDEKSDPQIASRLLFKQA